MNRITEKLIKYDLSERLQACLTVEMQCADVYHTLVTLFPGSLFPEAKDLFQSLAEGEERHADIITVGLGFKKIDEIPHIIVPDDLPLINSSIDIARDIKARIGAERVTLKMALSMVLKMEESTAESYLQEVMTKTTDSSAVAARPVGK